MGHLAQHALWCMYLLGHGLASALADLATARSTSDLDMAGVWKERPSEHVCFVAALLQQVPQKR